MGTSVMGVKRGCGWWWRFQFIENEAGFSWVFNFALYKAIEEGRNAEIGQRK